jgi:uncharacterized protein YpuA (DUF1002 family)
MGTAASILALINAAATILGEATTIYNQVKTTLSSDDQAQIEAALAAQQAKSDADYTRTQGELQAAAGE